MPIGWPTACRPTTEAFCSARRQTLPLRLRRRGSWACPARHGARPTATPSAEPEAFRGQGHRAPTLGPGHHASALAGRRRDPCRHQGKRDFTVKLPDHFTFHFTVKFTVKSEKCEIRGDNATCSLVSRVSTLFRHYWSTRSRFRLSTLCWCTGNGGGGSTLK